MTIIANNNDMFRAAEGRVRAHLALANGVDAATALSQSWHDDGESLMSRAVYYAALLLGHDRDAATCFTDQPRSKESQALRAQACEQLEIKPGDVIAVRERRGQLDSSNMVAGGAAEGHGVLVGWHGLGSLTRAGIRGILATANLPIDWTPEARSARGQAGDALGKLTSQGYVVRGERKSERQTVEAETYDTRWTVGIVDHASHAGDHFGEVVLVATLVGDKLKLEGRDALCEDVQAEYTRRINAEMYKAADVTAWMNGILYNRLSGVRFGGIWYVPRAFAPLAATMCAAFSRSWGVDWLVPALPVATTEQLQDGLVKGIAEEVAEVVRTIEGQRDAARTSGKVDVGQRAASSHMRRVRQVTERVIAYGHLLGERRVAKLREALDEAARIVADLLDDGMSTRDRFMLLWEEVEREVVANGGAL